MVFRRLGSDKLERALRKKAKQDYANARGTIHLREIEAALGRIQQFYDAAVANLQQLKQRLNGLQHTLKSELEQALVTYLVNNRLTEIDGVGDTRAAAIRSRIFQGQLRDLYQSHQIRGISTHVQSNISRWVREQEDQLPQLIAKGFPRKAQIEYKYRQEQRELDASIASEEKRVLYVERDLETLQRGVSALEGVTEQDFFHALTGKVGNETIVPYMMGVYSEWEEPPGWYQRLIMNKATSNSPESAPVQVKPNDTVASKQAPIKIPVAKAPPAQPIQRQQGSLRPQPPKVVSNKFIKHKGEHMGFSGTGNGVSDVMQLESGLYRVSYRIKNYEERAESFTLGCISTATGDNKEIAYDSNSGATTFMVENSGKYVLELKYAYPPDIPSDWTLKIELLS